MSRPVILQIDRSGSDFKFTIEPHEPGAAVVQYIRTGVDVELMRDLLRDIENVAKSGAGLRSLERAGQVIRDVILPPEIKNWLSKLDHPLLISTNAPEVPWELLHLSDEFLGLHCPVGRQLVVASEMPVPLAVETEQSLSFLIVANPGGDLPGAEREAEALQQIVREHQLREVTLLGEDAGRVRVLTALTARPAVIHFSGHASGTRTGNRLHLAGGQRLDADMLSHVLQGHPIVFLNACGTDRRQSSGRRPRLDRRTVEFLAEGFIRGGARCVIGTHWEVDDEIAITLSQAFYRELLTGAPIGMALKQARQAARDAASHDATWAAYTLYGDPTARLVTPLPFGASVKYSLNYAATTVRYFRHPFITSTHLFMGLSKVPDGLTMRALQAQNLDPKYVRAILREVLVRSYEGTPAPQEGKGPVISSSVAAILGTAEVVARKERALAVSEDHVLRAMFETGKGQVFNILAQMGVDLEVLAASARGEDVDHIQMPYANSDVGSQGGPQINVQAQARPAAAEPVRVGAGLYLDQIGRDLTQAAREGQLMPVVGRQQEMEQIIRILLRQTKNNPVLVGEAGVGKTAIVEGLAQRIVEGRVPSQLRNKRLIEITMGTLLAGTRYRGDFEERVESILKEAQNNTEILLFIDEVHTIVGSGQVGDSALDAGNMFKPALARGELRCIGATTPSEYQKSIGRDAALARRFHQVIVNESTQEEALEILTRLRERYAATYGVSVEDEALEAAVRMSVIYLPDRRLPDKACDLLEEACVRVSIGAPSSWSNDDAPAGNTSKLTVGAEDIAAVVAGRTGIPVTRLSVDQQAQLLNLEERLTRRIIGQDEAVERIVAAIRVGYTPLKDPRRPIAVFLLLGPTGVGKTELAQALCQELFGSTRDLVRLDMSEFAEAHSVAKLIGAPPGYVGYREEGMLTGALRRKPFCVVLIDEIEKADPQVFDVFLQLFDEGRLTDGQGRTVDGRQAIFIMTSNVITKVGRQRSMGFTSAQTDATELLREETKNVLHATFRPEFLNRIDEVVIFRPLSSDDVLAIARLQVDDVAHRLKTERGITLEVEDDALRLICDEGYDVSFGARHLRRAMERLIVRPLSTFLLMGDVDTVRARTDSDRIVFEGV